MIIYPVLQLQGGHCVSLDRGRMTEPSVWHGDPVDKALGFVEAGAEWLHVTDLDAVAGTGSNADTIRAIIRQAGVPVQVAGGIRSDDRVRGWIDAGAGRVVVGTAAVRFPDWVKAKAKAHPDQVAVSIDVWKGQVVVEGWGVSSALDAVDLVHAYDGAPLAAMIVTDIDRDLDLPDASLAFTTRLAEQTRTPLIASGVVKTLDDVSRLRYLPNIAGAMIGRPLMDRSIDLSKAIALARPAPEQVASFQ